MEAAGQGESQRTFCPCHRARQDAEVAQAKLYEEVGRLKMELDWKKTGFFG
jgi:hypothetical protein